MSAHDIFTKFGVDGVDGGNSVAHGAPPEPPPISLLHSSTPLFLLQNNIPLVFCIFTILAISLIQTKDHAPRLSAERTTQEDVMQLRSHESSITDRPRNCDTAKRTSIIRMTDDKPTTMSSIVHRFENSYSRSVMTTKGVALVL